ncbi:type I-E CRISPR-associated protein Cse1/CasA [Lujinxingia sediminis]|uniref:Type I-E CRISPR-associated protein Cse1/CasA n=1 Tax=Lujinxingia sediminis TaxID=2480984 RepID=A0ABY0CUY9_9DELT|nr:type I-E CRISPR-associated protein Cse1/CasA [Lujinxingia sediminis]RVU45721.1 type I-E CRISPR-associated protein Cse1/CasA [Lujinxingia sediminis]
MSLNLIRDRWIPVVRMDGSKDVIRPAEMVAMGQESPPRQLLAARPDFNGTLIQFLIGLVQTTMMPSTPREWRRRRREEPSRAELEAAFEPWESAFELDAEEGPRFMQDFNCLEGEGKKKCLRNLLFNESGNSSSNKDLYTKRRNGVRFCSSCTAQAIFTLMLNATAGGSGHRVSLRGGGPMTTVVLGKSLWETVWSNVLDREFFIRKTRAGEVDTPEAIFPWLAPTVVSSDGTEVHPDQVNGLQAFWGMPRRIDLELQDCAPGHCGVCGERAEQTYESYRDKPHGVNYKGPWIHPLTSYQAGKTPSDAPNPTKGQLGGITYRNWVGFAINNPGRQAPAAVVERMQKLEGVGNIRTERLWAFGYDVDKDKVRSWHESKMPVVLVPEGQRERFEEHARAMVAGAGFAASVLVNALRRAFYGEPDVTSTGKVTWRVADAAKADKALFAGLEREFWGATEPLFYDEIDRVVGQKSLDASQLNAWRVGWGRTLRNEALAIFDRVAEPDPGRGFNPRAVVLARRGLSGTLRIEGKKFAKELTITELPAAAE